MGGLASGDKLATNGSTGLRDDYASEAGKKRSLTKKGYPEQGGVGRRSCRGARSVVSDRHTGESPSGKDKER